MLWLGPIDPRGHGTFVELLNNKLLGTQPFFHFLIFHGIFSVFPGYVGFSCLPVLILLEILAFLGYIIDVLYIPMQKIRKIENLSVFFEENRLRRPKFSQKVQKSPKNRAAGPQLSKNPRNLVDLVA